MRFLSPVAGKVRGPHSGKKLHAFHVPRLGEHKRVFFFFKIFQRSLFALVAGLGLARGGLSV